MRNKADRKEQSGPEEVKQTERNKGSLESGTY